MRLQFWIGLILGGMVLSGSALADSAVKPAQLMVTIFNATGIPAQDANLYVYDVRAKTFQTIPYKDEPVTLMLPPGRYRLYSSFSAQMGDYIARFASPEATIKLGKGEIETLILSLEEGADPTTLVSYATLQKVHVPHEMQQYLQ